MKQIASRNKYWKKADAILAFNLERTVVRKRIIKHNLIKYKCNKCGNNGEWNEENLEFLCPNCHSQTKTFGSKNINNEKRKEAVSLKREKEKEKIKTFNELLKERRKILDLIDTTKFGWVKKVQDEWGG